MLPQRTGTVDGERMFKGKMRVMEEFGECQCNLSSFVFRLSTASESRRLSQLSQNPLRPADSDVLSSQKKITLLRI